MFFLIALLRKYTAYLYLCLYMKIASVQSHKMESSQFAFFLSCLLVYFQKIC